MAFANLDILLLCSIWLSGLGALLKLLLFSKMASFYVFTGSLIVLSFVNFESTSKSLTAHWRTLPHCCCTILLWIWMFIGKRLNLSNWIEVILCIVCLIVELISVLLVFLLPVPNLRSPTGNCAVGTLSFTLPVELNDSMDTVSGACKNAQGKILVPIQCWFPLKSSKSSSFLQKALLWTSGCSSEEEAEAFLLANTLARTGGMKGWMLHHLVLSRSYSQYQPNVNYIDTSKGKLPVVIYSHGLHGWRQVHTTLCEELASQGYLVFAIDHMPCGTLGRPIFQLDHSVSFNFPAPAAFPEGSPEHKAHYGDGIDRRINDISVLIDYLSCSTGDSDGILPLFSSYADVESIHLCGHSYGAVTSVCYALRDPRIKSVMGLDGWFFPMSDQDLGRTSNAHILLLSSEHWAPSKVSPICILANCIFKTFVLD